MNRSCLAPRVLAVGLFFVAVAEARDDLRSDSEVFAARRRALIEQLEAGAVVMAGAPVRHRNGDVDYDYRQASDFYYLTGFEEPGASLILRFDGDEEPHYHLIVPPKNPAAEIWDGHRAGVEGARAVHGADRASSNRELGKVLAERLDGVERIYYGSHGNDAFDAELQKWVESRPAESPVEIEPVRPALSRLRQIKDEEELRLLRRAVAITCEGLRDAMKAAEPGRYEYEVESVLEFAFRRNGSPRNGFPSIVGSGPNTTILHYVTNRRRMEKGDLLLMDVGAEYGYYTADVTRTIPVSGRFTEEQRAIYSIVLQAQKACIEMVRPDVPLFSIHQKAREIIGNGLADLGLIERDDEDRIPRRRLAQFFMHGTSHWLGMDVHDVGSQPVLKPGMVFTIEPGIYVRDELESVDPKYHGIGVRIEDDILVTEDGCEVLSISAPREMEAIETWMAGEEER